MGSLSIFTQREVDHHRALAAMRAGLKRFASRVKEAVLSTGPRMEMREDELGHYMSECGDTNAVDRQMRATCADVGQPVVRN